MRESVKSFLLYYQLVVLWHLSPVHRRR